MNYYLEERSLVRKDAFCPKSFISCKSSSSIISKGRASSSSSSSLSILLTVPPKRKTEVLELGIFLHYYLPSPQYSQQRLGDNCFPGKGPSIFVSDSWNLNINVSMYSELCLWASKHQWLSPLAPSHLQWLLSPKARPQALMLTPWPQPSVLLVSFGYFQCTASLTTYTDFIPSTSCCPAHQCALLLLPRLHCMYHLTHHPANTLTLHD